MGNPNQWLYLQRFTPRIQGAVLEVGSKNYGTTVPFRERLSYTEYLGLDKEAGDGVDVVGDLALGVCGLRPGSFALVICCSVLEHVATPWTMAQNITRLLGSGGICYLAVPWVWRFHAYPDDYWRFSWRGIETLFPSLLWSHGYYSTNKVGTFLQAQSGSDDMLALMVKGQKYLPYLQLHMLGRKP